MSHKSEMAGPFNRGDTIINKHFLLTYGCVPCPHCLALVHPGKTSHFDELGRKISIQGNAVLTHLRLKVEYQFIHSYIYLYVCTF